MQKAGSAARPPRYRSGLGLGAATVVAADLRPVRLVPVRVLVELGRILDLVLREPDEDRLRVGVDPLDHARREHDLLPEDPRPRVDDDVAAADLVGRFVDLSDPAVGRFDRVTGEVGRAPSLLAVRPDLCRDHPASSRRLQAWATPIHPTQTGPTDRSSRGRSTPAAAPNILFKRGCGGMADAAGLGPVGASAPLEPPARVRRPLRVAMTARPGYALPTS